MKIIETTRLVIREVNIADLDLLADILSDAEVMRYSFRGVCTPSEIDNYIIDCQANYKTNGFGQWAVIDKSNQKFIGLCGINNGFNGDLAIKHVNYRFAVSSWGRGFATEALSAVMEVAKNRYSLKELYALIEPENKASLKIALNQGFEFDKETIYKKKILAYYRKLL